MAVSYVAAQPPAYLEQFQRDLLQGAFNVTKDPYPGGIPKQGITGFQPLQEGAIQGTAGLYGIDPTTGKPTGAGAGFDPAFKTGQATTGAGIQSLQAAQAQFDPSSSNYQNFFNQYQADVTKNALKQIDEEAAKQRANLAGQATMGGVFGGSRYGVQQAELDKNILDIKSRRVFEDLSRNFEQAQNKAIGTFESAAGRRLQASPVFGQLGAQQAALGAQQFGMQQQGLGSLFTLGGAQQQQAQQIENEKFRQAIEAQQEPLKRLGFFSDIMQGVPGYQSTSTYKEAPYTNPLLGAIGAGLGTYGVLTGGNSAGAFGLGSLS
jgi:hypothetical protein|tara:strand:+ start:73 stop:1035 length:963 start_codon:yes stop_codon:yes gene_type:complete